MRRPSAAAGSLPAHPPPSATLPARLLMWACHRPQPHAQLMVAQLPSPTPPHTYHGAQADVERVDAFQNDDAAVGHLHCAVPHPPALLEVVDGDLRAGDGWGWMGAGLSVEWGVTSICATAFGQKPHCALTTAVGCRVLHANAPTHRCGLQGAACESAPSPTHLRHPACRQSRSRPTPVLLTPPLPSPPVQPGIPPVRGAPPSGP